jgi:hypothetical protein
VEEEAEQDMDNSDDEPNWSERIHQLLPQSSLNLSSPTQVSRAIFGNVQSASRAALQDVVEGQVPGVTDVQRQLAMLVLDHRQWQARRRRRPSRNVPETSQSHLLSDVVESVEEEEHTAARVSFPVENESDGMAETPQQLVTDDWLASDESTELSIMDPYEQRVDTLLGEKSKISPYWKDSLLQLSRPSARSLVSQLNPDCPLGYDPLAVPLDPLSRKSSSLPPTTTTAGKKGSFLAYCRDQKERHPDCVILTRCGDFYETFGIDALLLIEHCGLNPMGSKAKAGCPIRNVQATIDGLTEQGFSVAVYEEAADTNAGGSGGSKSRIKNRFLAQIVSAASPTYLYDLLLLTGDSLASTATAARPFCGIISLSAGYTLVEVSWEERTVQVSERLTAEAVACRLAAYPPADPLFYVPAEGGTTVGSTSQEALPFLPSRRELASAGYGARLRTRILPPSLVAVQSYGQSESERAQQVIVQAVVDMASGDDPDTTVDNFTLVSASATEDEKKQTRTRPLYVETATQLGLLQDRTIPSLLSYVLPDAAPAATKRFLRRLLLTPPPPVVADALATLVIFCKERGISLPSLNVPPIGKVLSLLRAGQASAQVYGELLQTLTTTMTVLERLRDQEAEVVKALMVVLEYESGLAGDPESLWRRCELAKEAIEAVISPLYHGNTRVDEMDDTISDYGNCIPLAFLERNEMAWRGRIRPDAMRESYERVGQAADELAEAVRVDFWLDQVGEGKNLVVQDIFNNLFALKAVPEGVADQSLYIHPRDRFGKILRNRFTTLRVQEALSNYVSTSDRACRDVASALAALSKDLNDDGHLPAIVQAAHSNLILSASYHHAAKANMFGWERAKVREVAPDGEKSFALSLQSVWPYWMDRRAAVGNTIEIDGMWLLTAPNMSGKSTLMRSTAAAALLSVCGLCAPVAKGSYLQRFDHLFVRGASADIPTEQKSAFGAEMGDVAALLRCCGDNSLVFVDELGRGTSPRDGTRLAGALLEAMATTGMKGIFATHLHAILDLPLGGKDCTSTKRMAIHDRDEQGHESEDFRWTYRLEDGVCRDSMALMTASRFGLPESVLARAEALGEYLPESCGSASEVSPYLRINSDTNKAVPQIPSNLTTIVKDVTGQDAVSIPPRWSTPSSLEVSYSGRLHSCLDFCMCSNSL